MKICPICGAENRQTANECRMCATPLDPLENQLAACADAPAPTVTPAPGREPTQQFTACPHCRAMNEIDYIFCQHCGKRMPGHKIAGVGQSRQVSPYTSHEQIAEERVICGACGESVTSTGFYCHNCGARLTKLASPEPKAVLQLIAEGGQVGKTYLIDKPDTLIGRTEGDITFPYDAYMSSRHVRVIERGGRYYLSDQGSRNGTFVRIKGEIELEPGDMFFVGKQLFRFDEK
jgi:uncharacterized CHY-type Zn-finger protein